MSEAHKCHASATASAVRGYANNAEQGTHEPNVPDVGFCRRCCASSRNVGGSYDPGGGVSLRPDEYLLSNKRKRQCQRPMHAAVAAGSEEQW